MKTSNSLVGKRYNHYRQLVERFGGSMSQQTVRLLREALEPQPLLDPIEE